MFCYKTANFEEILNHIKTNNKTIISVAKRYHKSKGNLDIVEAIDEARAVIRLSKLKMNEGLSVEELRQKVPVKLEFPKLDDYTHIIEAGFKSKLQSTYENMLDRVSKRFKAKNPTYNNCTTTFTSQQDFSQWSVKQIGFGLPDYELDKDILKVGNTCYSRECCVYVPKDINMFYHTSEGRRGDQYKGVVKHYNKYIARISIDGVSNTIGAFTDAYEAFLAYKAAKESRAKELAEKYKSTIDPRVYNALLSYTAEDHN